MCRTQLVVQHVVDGARRRRGGQQVGPVAAQQREQSAGRGGRAQPALAAPRPLHEHLVRHLGFCNAKQVATENSSGS